MVARQLVSKRVARSPTRRCSGTSDSGMCVCYPTGMAVGLHGRFLPFHYQVRVQSSRRLHFSRPLQPPRKSLPHLAYALEQEGIYARVFDALSLSLG